LTALANAMAESFVDTYKTELIADRVWRSRAQLELATVNWVSWYNHQRLHESLGDVPPVEFETVATSDAPISANGSVASVVPRPANGLRARRLAAVGADSLHDAVAARSQPNASSPSKTLLTLDAARGVRPPSGVVSDLRDQDGQTG
jgi:hypothetical protein